jgi:prepilin-type processing-associated H-X9-DG protein/prepilin-type N-terminal cleavage/methylation domain-containing protein
MRRAFTLVELLLVIGIIALLIAILMPVMSRARAAAMSISCLSNLRQMTIAAQAYAGESHGYYPPAQWNDLPGVKQEWDFALENGVIVPGLLWRGHTALRVQQCPGFDGRNNSPGDPYTGYNYNTSFIGRGYREGPPAKATDVQSPTSTAMFGDGQWKLGANKYMRSPKPSPTEDSWSFAEFSAAKASGTQGYRHLGRTNIGFCDGHAESLGYPVFNAPRSDVAKGTGFLSADNSLYDLK